MATWSDVSAGDGMRPPEGGAEHYNYGNDGDEVPGGDPWNGGNARADGSEGWSWNFDDEEKADGKDPELGSQQGAFSTTSSRRRRGKRGSGGSTKGTQQRWRSG